MTIKGGAKESQFFQGERAVIKRLSLLPKYNNLSLSVKISFEKLAKVLVASFCLCLCRLAHNEYNVFFLTPQSSSRTDEIYKYVCKVVNGEADLALNSNAIYM